MTNYDPEKYARLQGMGLCPKCGAEPIAQDRKWGRRCLDRQAKARKDKYVPKQKRGRIVVARAGDCTGCGRNDHMTGSPLCWCCAQKVSA